MKLSQIALRNIFRNKRRSLLSGAATAIAAMSIVLLFSLLAGMLEDMRENTWTYMTGAVRIRHADFDKYERLNPLHLAISDYEALLEDIEADPAVSEVSTRISFPGQVIIKGADGEADTATAEDSARVVRGDEKIRITGTAVDFDRESAYQDFETTLVEGRLPEAGKAEAAIGYKLAEKLGVGLGDRFTVLSASGSRGSNAMTFTATALMNYPMAGLNSTFMQIPLDTAQEFLWLPGKVQEILIKVDEGAASPEKVAERLKINLESEVPLSILTFKEANIMASYIDLARSIYDILGIVFFILASTVIINTTMMVIFERMREIGTLAAMGMTGGSLVKLFFLEALFISVAGALAGVLIGTSIAAYLGTVGFNFFSKAMENMDNVGMSTVLYPIVNMRSTVLVFLYAVVIALLATWLPARKVAKISPIKALLYV